MYIDTHPRQILEDLKDISNLASAFIRDIERLEEEKNLKMLDIKIK